jgi:hypothetical protein
LISCARVLWRNQRNANRARARKHAWRKRVRKKGDT